MRYVLHPDVRIRKENFGAILIVPFDLERPDIPQFYKLNQFGTAIIELCSKPIKYSDLLSMLARQPFSYTSEDVETFINELVNIGILSSFSESINYSFESTSLMKENLKNTPSLGSPLSVFVEITDMCPLSCVHCYTKSTHTKQHFKENNEWLKMVFKDIIEIGAMTVGIGGGEPTTVKSLSKHIHDCHSNGIKTSISTNGVFVDDNMVRNLKDAGLGIAQISIDGPKSIHDSIRGEGSFVKALDALCMFSEQGVETRVAMTVSALNYKCVEETAFMAFKSGADRFVVFRYMPYGRGRRKYLLNKEQLKETTEILVELHRTHPDTVIGYEPLCFFPHLIDDTMIPLGPCNAGSDMMNICFDGRVTPCPHMREYLLGEYPKESLADLWNKSKMLGKRILHSHPQKCDPCRFKTFCGGGCSASMTNDTKKQKDSMCWL